MRFGEMFRRARASASPEGRAVGRLYQQNKEDNLYFQKQEEDRAKPIPKELEPFAEKISAVLETNKAEIFSLIAELDDKDTNTLSLAEAAAPWSYELVEACFDLDNAAEDDEQAELAIARSLEQWFAKATGTQDVYAASGWMDLDWISGAEGARRLAQRTYH